MPGVANFVNSIINVILVIKNNKVVNLIDLSGDLGIDEFFKLTKLVLFRTSIEITLLGIFVFSVGDSMMQYLENRMCAAICMCGSPSKMRL